MQVVPEKIDPIVQVVPDRIFSVAFHPGGEKLVAGAGDKWGKVPPRFSFVSGQDSAICVCSHFVSYSRLSFYAS